MLEPHGEWHPPQWQLVTPFGVYDYDRKPGWLARIRYWRLGWRWRRNPALTAGYLPRR